MNADPNRAHFAARIAAMTLACGFIGPAPGLAQVAQVPLIAGDASGTSGAGACTASVARGVFSTPGLQDGALFIRSGFVAGRWQGHVVAYDARAWVTYLGGGSAEPAPVWRAAVPPPHERRVYTSTAQNASAAFEWCALAAEQRAMLDASYAAAAPCPASAPPVLDYLRGDALNESRNGGDLRDRPGTVLGDVVNSTPVYSKATDHAYQLAPAASYSAGGAHGHTLYRAYVQSKRDSRVPVTMFGANDGMLHIVDARAGSGGGQELLAYVPRAAYPALRSLADPAYSHVFTVDGPVVEGDVWNGTAWRTLAIGTTGAGSPGIFALDVTSPGAAMDRRNVLWDVTSEDHADAAVRSGLGRTIGEGVIGSVLWDTDGSASTLPNGAWAYIVGNGYESRDGRAVLLVFDVRNGALIRAIDAGVGDAGNPNGLGAVAPVYDGNRNIVAVYAGDRLGNLWKFDLGSSNPVNWKVFNEQPAGSPRPLFTATQPGAMRPVHQAPRLAPHPLGGLYVLFGTGRLFEIGDLNSTDDQGIFVVRDQGKVAPIGFAELALLRTEEYTSASGTFRRVRSDDLSAFDWSRSGYWLRLRPTSLATSGERVVAPLVIDGTTLVVSTFSPDVGVGACGPGGISYLYRIDLASGLAGGGFGAEGGATIGRRVAPTIGGYTPLYVRAEPGGAPVRSLSAAELEALILRSTDRLTGNAASTVSSCLHAALTIDGSAAAVPTNCAGVLPLRAWRPMK